MDKLGGKEETNLYCKNHIAVTMSSFSPCDGSHHVIIHTLNYSFTLNSPSDTAKYRVWLFEIHFMRQLLFLVCYHFIYSSGLIGLFMCNNHKIIDKSIFQKALCLLYLNSKFCQSSIIENKMIKLDRRSIWSSSRNGIGHRFKVNMRFWI